MRKDVRFGLTIAGILVVILAVWLALPENNAPKMPPEIARLDTDSTTQPSDDTGSTPAPSDTVPPVTTELPPTTQPEMAAAAPPPSPNWDAALATGIVPSQSTTPQPSEVASAPMDAKTSAVVLAAQETPAPIPGVTSPDNAVPAGSTMPPSIPTTEPTATTSSAPRSHTVVSGESFYTIAKGEYGDGSLYARLEDANPNIDPNRLRVGMVITIPELTGGAPAARTATRPERGSRTEANSSGRTYRVQASDTLIRIARKVYGNGQDWQKIYQANRDVIGDNPARLKVGMELKLPVLVTVATHP